jgi:hypothetical protein
MEEVHSAGFEVKNLRLGVVVRRQTGRDESPLPLEP